KPLSPSGFHDIASPYSLERIMAALEHRRGYLRMPKFGLDYAADLTAELQEMGMGRAFAADADFSALFDRNIPAFLSKVTHKTRLEIDEQGTTAAASTAFRVAAGLDGASTLDTPCTMTVDRPIPPLTTDNATHMILFSSMT